MQTNGFQPGNRNLPSEASIIATVSLKPRSRTAKYITRVTKVKTAKGCIANIPPQRRADGNESVQCVLRMQAGN